MKGDIFKNKMQALLEMRAERDVERDGASEWEWVRERESAIFDRGEFMSLSMCVRACTCMCVISEGTWSGSRLQDCLIAFLQVCRQQNCLTAATIENFCFSPANPPFSAEHFLTPRNIVMCGFSLQAQTTPSTSLALLSSWCLLWWRDASEQQTPYRTAVEKSVHRRKWLPSLWRFLAYILCFPDSDFDFISDQLSASFFKEPPINHVTHPLWTFHIAGDKAR